VDARSLAEILAAHEASGLPYLEFMRAESLSVGVYILDAGAIDGQSPHTEDEVYVVLEGRSQFTAGDETRAVATGDVIFVAAGVAHRFHDITERLRLIVLFAPPEYSRSSH
jgi:mannose-6-phosphate isomerase-like protein (cupin superfamily)